MKTMRPSTPRPSSPCQVMAKIKAYGDREARRWTRGEGAALVLTERGRLLHKSHRGARLKLLIRKVEPGCAEEFASERGMEER